MSKVNQGRIQTLQIDNANKLKQFDSILKKAESGQQLTKEEVETFNSIAAEASGLGLVATKDQLAMLEKGKSMANKGVFSAQGAGTPPPPPPIPTTPRLSGSAGNPETRSYEQTIEKQAQAEIGGYESLLKQQQEAFTKQLTSQQDFLGSQLSTIQQQSAAQQESYQALLTQLTQKQEQELGSLREQYSQQNLKSEETIAQLQKDIERLSTINKPPTINVDTRPALIGQSKAQKASQERQRLGLVGTRRSTPTAAQGLRTVGSLGLTIAS